MVALHSILLQQQLGNLRLHQTPADDVYRLLTSIAKQGHLEGVKPVKMTGSWSVYHRFGHVMVNYRCRSGAAMLGDHTNKIMVIFAF